METSGLTELGSSGIEMPCNERSTNVYGVLSLKQDQLLAQLCERRHDFATYTEKKGLHIFYPGGHE